MTDPDSFAPPRSRLRDKIDPRTAAYVGAGIGIPSTLYTAGLMHQGVPLRRVPQAALGDIRALGKHQVGPNKILQGSLGPIGATMRTGVGAIGRGTWGSVKGGSQTLGMNLKAFYKGLRGIKKLSAKLDDIINFNSK